MKSINFILLAILTVALCACNWFKGDDPVGPPSLDVQFIGSVLKASGATYEAWTIEVTFPDRGNDTYSAKLSNAGEFRFMAAWPPSETHIVTVRGMSNIEVWSFPNVPWENWGTNTWKYDFVIQ